MNEYRKKLIEVALPLAEINDASAYDKMPGIGPHPKGIHQWWARLPLPTARAVLFASVVDDPSSHPEKFPTEEAQNAERERLFDLLRQLMQKKMHEHPEVYAAARAEMLQHCDGKLPPVLDPFAGGGSIPLEAARLGFLAHAADLNPVAVLLNKCNLEIVPRWLDHPPVNPEARTDVLCASEWKGARGLAEDVRYYGRVVLERAREKIGHLYPKVHIVQESDGTWRHATEEEIRSGKRRVREANVIAWLWARTVASPNPAAKGEHVPLVRSFWLSTKNKGRRAYVMPSIDNDRCRYEFQVRIGTPPDGFDPTKGTVNRNGARCLLTGTSIPFEYIRQEGKAGRLQFRLMAIVVELPHGRTYVSPNPKHKDAAETTWPSEAPDTDVPEKALGFRVQLYGMNKHYKMFSPRQLTALVTFSDLVREVRQDILEDASDTGLSNRDAEEYAKAVIHCLWERQDGNLLIMPANVPVDDPRVQFELTRYLEDQWVPVIEKDVDGARSLPLTLDRENPNLGRYSACRRVARTIYIGSAPIREAANRGIDDRQVRLGCVQPGESAAIFGDALRRLTDRATYLYVDGNRYWYSTQPTVTRLADDRAAQLREDQVLEEIARRLRLQARRRGDFARVHACASVGDVTDEREVRLVILGPEYSHTARDPNSPALQEAACILESRGSSPRTYKNTLVFLAADQARLRDLEQATRQYLAWKSIWEERETLNLDAFQSRQAETKCRTADETVDARLPEAYQWLLVPNQPDPKEPVAWEEIRQQGRDALAVRASKKLKNEEMLLTEFGGPRLRYELDRVPLWRGDHVGVKQLAEDFATYLYLPRLCNDSVLLEAIRDGLSRLTWQTETFAYADEWDEQGKKYVGLQTGQQVRVLIDGRSVLVKPDVAAAQMQADKQAAGVGQPAAGKGNGAPLGSVGVTTKPEVGGETTFVEQPPRRFHGSAVLDATRAGRDASRIAEEVIQHLAGLVGAKVEVTLEIHAEVPDGVPDGVIRTVTENCRTLKFRSYGFEKE